MFIVYSGVERDQQQVSLTITRSCYVSQSPILTKTSPTWTLVREVEVAVVVEVEVEVEAAVERLMKVVDSQNQTHSD